MSRARGRGPPGGPGSGIRGAGGSGTSARHDGELISRNRQSAPHLAGTGRTPPLAKWATLRTGRPRVILRAAVIGSRSCLLARALCTRSAPCFPRRPPLRGGADAKNSIAREPVCPRDAGRACLPPVIGWRCCLDCAVPEPDLVPAARMNCWRQSLGNIATRRTPGKRLNRAGGRARHGGCLLGPPAAMTGCGAGLLACAHASARRDPHHACRGARGCRARWTACG